MESVNETEERLRAMLESDNNLRFESEPGKGSRFICEVRLGVVSSDSPEKKDTHDNTVIADLTGKRVLVVDDVEINREILTALMEDTGAIIDKARDGYEAVNKFLQEKYDLVLIDLHMPVMDGFTAVKKIRAANLAWAKTIPIISVSADSSAGLQSKCMEAGISDYFQKPIEMEALHKMISKWMQKNEISEKIS